MDLKRAINIQYDSSLTMEETTGILKSVEAMEMKVSWRYSRHNSKSMKVIPFEACESL